MSETRSNVPLPPEVRAQYQAVQQAEHKAAVAADAPSSGLMLKELHVSALRAFLGYRLEMVGSGSPFRHYVAPRDAVPVTIILPESLTAAAREAADQDGVSLRQFLHTALVWHAETNLPRSGRKPRSRSGL